MIMKYASVTNKSGVGMSLDGISEIFVGSTLIHCPVTGMRNSVCNWDKCLNESFPSLSRF